MIEFEKLVTKSEVKAQYLNLTDTDGKTYGDMIGEHGDVFKVLDEKRRPFQMKRHHGNQLTRCTEWFQQKNILPNARLLIRYDKERGVLHLLPVPAVLPDQNLLLGAVAFNHAGKNYDVRCSTTGGKVRLMVLLDGRPAEDFEL